MLLTTLVAEMIQKSGVHSIKEAIEQSMQTFDQALYKLYKMGKITLEDALPNADSRNNLSLKICLDERGGINVDEVDMGLSIGDDEPM